MKSVGIVYRDGSKNAKLKAIELAKWAAANDLKPFSHPDQNLGKTVAPLSSKNIEKLDLVVVLGGDGTYLEAVRMLKGAKVPILGVNMGSLGFLTVFRKDELFHVLPMALKGELELRPRSMIEVVVYRGKKKIGEHQVLNDVVFERGPFSHLISLEISSGGQIINDLKADGIVIATPTGSTAYNLAAGGPILHPSVKSFVVTPICAHSLTYRPIIFSDAQALTIRLSRNSERCFLTVDGQNGGEVRKTDTVEIRKAKCDHWILRKYEHDYFALLREKLSFGERN